MVGPGQTTKMKEEMTRGRRRNRRSGDGVRCSFAATNHTAHFCAALEERDDRACWNAAQVCLPPCAHAPGSSFAAHRATVDAGGRAGSALGTVHTFRHGGTTREREETNDVKMTSAGCWLVPPREGLFRSSSEFGGMYRPSRSRGRNEIAGCFPTAQCWSLELSPPLCASGRCRETIEHRPLALSVSERVNTLEVTSLRSITRRVRGRGGVRTHLHKGSSYFPPLSLSVCCL